MAKQLLFDEAARHAMKAGIDALADAVKITLGPKGRWLSALGTSAAHLSGSARSCRVRGC